MNAHANLGTRSIAVSTADENSRPCGGYNGGGGQWADVKNIKGDVRGQVRRRQLLPRKGKPGRNRSVIVTVCSGQDKLGRM